MTLGAARDIPVMRADAREVRKLLAKILASESFVNAPRVQQFLRFVVEETLEGRGGELKESVIATRVFNRRSDFDSRNDSVVRVEATHVRKRLRDYYAGEGRLDSLILEFPARGYAPVFRVVAIAEPGLPEHSRLRLAAAAALVLLAVALGYWGWWVWGTWHHPPSIAVLPFTNLDGVPETDYFADGLAEDLAVSLAQTSGLRVVARSSAFQFRGKQVDARVIGRQLGVGAMVEGSVRRNGERVRITAQLVSAATGYDLWSGSYEGAAADVPVIQEQIAREVRSRLKPRGAAVAAASAEKSRPTVQGALEAYWRGRYLLRKGTEGRAGSIRYFEEAIRLDPQYAPARAALTTTYATMAFHLEGAVHELAGKAREAGSRALELDPNSAETHASLATLSYSYDHDWPSAQAGFERALELNPSYARAHLQYAMGLVTRGRFDAAVAHVRQARALDPLSYAIGNDLAVALYCAGRFDEAIAAARGTLEADRNYAPAHVIQGSSMAVKGDLAGALREDEQAIRKMGREPWILGRMGYALARAGRRADAERVAREIQATQGPAMQLALVYAGLGDKQRALDAMEQAARQRETDLNFMAVDPMLAALRGEARFVALKNSIGL